MLRAVHAFPRLQTRLNAPMSVYTLSGCINLGNGQPNEALLPLDRLQRVMPTALEGAVHQHLNYGPERGFSPFIEALAQFLTEHYGHVVREDELSITNGNSAALALCCRTLAGRGDKVLVERETYFLSRLIFRDHGLETVPVDCDGEGVREDALAAAIKEHRPKFLYVIPTHHNPTARTTSDARRRRIVELCTAEGCPVVSDDVYQLLSFPGAEAPIPMREVEKQHRGEGSAQGEKADLPGPVVISLGSFSKIWAPATRLGWVQAHPSTIGRLIRDGVNISGGGVNPIMERVVATAMAQRQLQEHMLHVRAELEARHAALQRAADEHLRPLGCTVSQAEGGYFVWVALPEGVGASQVRDLCRGRAEGERADFHGGWKFGDGLEHCLRLGYSAYEAGDVAEGVARIGKAVKEAASR